MATFGDLERYNQGHLLKNMVSMRDSATVTMECQLGVMVRKSDGIINLSVGDLETSD